jgi:hypothetical protein
MEQESHFYVLVLSEPGQSLKAALDIVHRYIDCAVICATEVEIGEAVGKAFGVNKGSKHWERSIVFIISKLWNTRHNPAEVKYALQDFGVAVVLDLTPSITNLSPERAGTCGIASVLVQGASIVKSFTHKPSGATRSIQSAGLEDLTA